MKKFALAFVSILMCLALFTGCDMLKPPKPVVDSGDGEGPAQTEIAQIAEKYDKIGEAATIVQEIGIARDGFVQFESAKTFTKNGQSYAVKGTERRLNALSSGKTEAYTETEIEETVASGAFEGKLELNELYFSSLKPVENGILEAVVADNSVEAVFGIDHALTAPVHGLALKIVTNETHVTDMDITYATSNGSTVTITLKFTY